MKLIRKLGTKIYSGRLESFGMFLCPDCLQEVEKTLSHGKRDKSCGCNKNKGVKNPMYGKNQTEETRQKMREAKLGKKATEETRKNISKGKEGHFVSENTKQKIGKGNKGKIVSEITKQKQSELAKKRIGELAPNWQNGKSFEEYPPEFNKELKQFILERDNYACQCPDCKIINPKKLDIHHIDYDKNNNNPDNLVVLCMSCHMKTNYNRNYYTEFYQTIMMGKLLECLL